MPIVAKKSGSTSATSMWLVAPTEEALDTALHVNAGSGDNAREGKEGIRTGGANVWEVTNIVEQLGKEQILLLVFFIFCVGQLDPRGQEFPAVENPDRQQGVFQSSESRARRR